MLYAAFTKHFPIKKMASLLRGLGREWRYGYLCRRLHTSTVMIDQVEFTLRERPQGCHLVTGEIEAALPPLPRTGLLHLLLKHTSAAICLNENYDPDVRTDLNQILHRLVPEGEPYYRHTLEGLDDMPAHAIQALIGAQISIPITNGKMNLGTWQGIYLCELRRHGGRRSVVATVIGG